MAAFRQSRADAGSAACAARRGRHRRVRTKKSWIAARSSIVQAPRQPENLGVESAQQKGDSPMELVTPSPLGPYAALDRLGDEIAGLSAPLDAATAPLLDLIREFDARGGWNTGFRSCAAWLSWRVGLDPGAARGRGRGARALATLPLLAEARETALRQERRGLRVYQDEDGMVIVRGRLEPEVGALFMQALAAARETLYQRARGVEGEAERGNVSAETPPTMSQKQADALALHAETALQQGLDPGTPGERYQVVVHVDAPVLADPDQPGQSVLEDGARVSAET